MGSLKDRRLAVALRKALEMGCKVAVGVNGEGKVIAISNEEDLIYYVNDLEKRELEKGDKEDE